jgi:hypothetical protein
LSESIPFWENPQDPEANVARAQHVLAAYTSLLASGSPLRSTARLSHTVANLAAANPPCHENVYTCAFAEHWCKPELYSQICTVCGVASEGCVVAPSDFTFPKLAKATVTAIASGSSSNSGSSWDGSVTTPALTPAPTPAPTTTAPRSKMCAKKPKIDANSSKIHGGLMCVS